MEGVAVDLGVQELNQERDLFLKKYAEINLIYRFDNGWNENSMNSLIRITLFLFVPGCICCPCIPALGFCGKNRNPPAGLIAAALEFGGDCKA